MTGDNKGKPHCLLVGIWTRYSASKVHVKGLTNLINLFCMKNIFPLILFFYFVFSVTSVLIFPFSTHFHLQFVLTILHLILVFYSLPQIYFNLNNISRYPKYFETKSAIFPLLIFFCHSLLFNCHSSLSSLLPYLHFCLPFLPFYSSIATYIR
jgi:hypothetical protein